MMTLLSVFIFVGMLVGLVISVASWHVDRVATRDAYLASEKQLSIEGRVRRIAVLEAECRIPIEEMVRRAERQVILDYRREQFAHGSQLDSLN